MVEILHEGAELDAINRLVSAEQGKAAVDELMEKTRSFLQGTESSSAQLEKWLDRFIEDSDR